MKPLKTIAFAYNVRRSSPDLSNDSAHLEVDYDDQITIDTIGNYLKQLGYKVIPVEANEHAYTVLFENQSKIDLVLNYSLGLKGESGYAHIPTLCEILGLPYTGSGPLSQALLMNKGRVKDVYKAQGISHPAYQIFSSSSQKLSKELHFPLIVKPIARGSSAGITNKSVVHNTKDLATQVEWILQTFKEPALVETFIAGREFSIGLIGPKPQALPIIESNLKDLPPEFEKIDSFEVKWFYEEEVGADYFTCPAKTSLQIKNKIETLARNVWQALWIRDCCRIDMRLDKAGNLYVLDVNSPAGMIPPEVTATSYLPLAARTAGIEYPQLLETIINSARTRYNI